MALEQRDASQIAQHHSATPTLVEIAEQRQALMIQRQCAPGIGAIKLYIAPAVEGPCNAAYVAEPLKMADALIQKCRGAIEVALVAGHIPQPVQRLGNAQPIAQLAAQRQAFLI